MDQRYFSQIESVRNQRAEGEARLVPSFGQTMFNKDLMIFCVNCSSMVSRFPLPTYMKCKCSHGLREKREYWGESWIQVVMTPTLKYLYQARSVQT